MQRHIAGVGGSVHVEWNADRCEQRMGREVFQAGVRAVVQHSADTVLELS